MARVFGFELDEIPRLQTLVKRHRTVSEFDTLCSDLKPYVPMVSDVRNRQLI